MDAVKISLSYPTRNLQSIWSPRTPRNSNVCLIMQVLRLQNQKLPSWKVAHPMLKLINVDATGEISIAAIIEAVKVLIM
jgi:hypothetical protein